jgi:2-keto-4-pentenoate hydratase/2-oxohepta-3-ene-1,7-dioic acid hydratase in catechol pathway
VATWASYSASGRTRCGVVVGDKVHPYPGGETLLDLITGDVLGPAAERALAAPAVDLDGRSIVAPFQPTSLRDSMSFHEHVRNAVGGELHPLHLQFPNFYFTNPAAVIGPFQDVPRAPGSEQFDYELEIGAVVGKAGHNIAPADAEEHIAGYTMFIDWSARDVQFTEMVLNIGPAKGKDTATTLGPFFVTADEFEPLRKEKGFDIGMRAAVNGREISHGNWSTINWSFRDIIAYASRGTTLRPGDVIGSGTVGRGCLLEHYRLGSPAFEGWLEPGDVVELSVDLIGDTRQTIVAGDPIHPLSSGW